MRGKKTLKGVNLVILKLVKYDFFNIYFIKVHLQWPASQELCLNKLCHLVIQGLSQAFSYFNAQCYFDFFFSPPSDPGEDK